MRDDGFTLVETLVVLLILALIFSLVAQLLLSGLKSSVIVQKQADMNEDLRIAGKRISNDLKQAKGIQVFDDKSSLVQGDMPAGVKITFTEPDNKLSGYRFDAIDGEIEKSYGYNNWLPITGRLRGLYFIYDTAEKTVVITVYGSNKDGSLMCMKTKVWLRVNDL